MASPVLTKKQNYRLWQGGAFGNKLRAWRTVDEWRASGFRGKAALRQLGLGGGRCFYNVGPDDVGLVLGRWYVEGVSLENVMVNEMAPDEAMVLQGEYLNDICLDEEGFALPGYFFYSTAKLHMRDALHAHPDRELAPQHTYGLRADLLLRAAMTPSSYEDWRVLLEQYPGHVLEVSIYDRCLGNVPGRNALVWEVRGY
jgi:hypothetical protein